MDGIQQDVLFRGQDRRRNEHKSTPAMLHPVVTKLPAFVSSFREGVYSQSAVKHGCRYLASAESMIQARGLVRQNLKLRERAILSGVDNFHSAAIPTALEP